MVANYTVKNSIYCFSLEKTWVPSYSDRPPVQDGPIRIRNEERGKSNILIYLNKITNKCQCC